MKNGTWTFCLPFNNLNSILGLAASLQARVLAQLKIEEENEERQRRQDIPANAIPTNRSAINIPLNPAQIKTEG